MLQVYLVDRVGRVGVLVVEEAGPPLGLASDHALALVKQGILGGGGGLVRPHTCIRTDDTVYPYQPIFFPYSMRYVTIYSGDLNR